MPDLRTAVADGLLPHGSFDVTMLETGTGYVADNFKFDENAKKVSTANSSGKTVRNKVIATDVTGSADFQLADETTLAPRLRETFACDADKDGVVEPYQIEKTGRTFQQDDIFKCSCSLYAMANPLIYDSVTLLAPVLPAATHSVALSATNALAAFLPRDVTLASNPWSATGLPAGVTMAASNGVLSGTPTTAGTYIVTMKVAGTITFVKNGAQVTESRIGARQFAWTVA